MFNLSLVVEFLLIVCIINNNQPSPTIKKEPYFRNFSHRPQRFDKNIRIVIFVASDIEIKNIIKIKTSFVSPEGPYANITGIYYYSWKIVLNTIPYWNTCSFTFKRDECNDEIFNSMEITILSRPKNCTNRQ